MTEFFLMTANATNAVTIFWALGKTRAERPFFFPVRHCLYDIALLLDYIPSLIFLDPLLMSPHPTRTNIACSRPNPPTPLDSYDSNSVRHELSTPL